MTGSFLNQGQVCAASSRIYIEAPLFDTLVSGFEQAVKSLQVGPGMPRRRRLTRWCRGALRQGGGLPR
jgi:acyl-CoA reductase-like NAD-dependent aldehyde dehydrogenase